MIFKKKRIELEYRGSNFWSQNVKSTTIVIKERKYRISRNGKQIIIERKINDFWDLVGFVPFKRLGIAKGEIQEEGSQIELNFEIRINQFVEILFLASIILFGCLVIWIMTQEFGAGLIFILGLMLIVYLQCLTFSNGLNGFYSDLKSDINYFK